jgi:hypothetical protein
VTNASYSLTRNALSIMFGWTIAGAALLLLLPGNVRAQTPTPTPTPPPTIKDIQPKVVQPDGLLALVFSEAGVKPVTVKVGNVDAVILPQSNDPKDVLRVKVAANTALGQQAIEATLPDNTKLTSSVTVAPLILGLKASKEETKPQLSKFVVAGGEVILQFASDIPSEIRQRLTVKLTDSPVTYTIPQNDQLLISVPDEIAETTYTVNVSIDGSDVLERAPKLGVVYTRWIYIRASANLVALILAVYLLYKVRSKLAHSEERYWFLKAVLLEPENQTYSLSRAQFAAWLVVIIWCYLFLYFAHGFVDQYWAFPNLGGAVYAFLISLGTLVVSQATTKGVGPKGAGEVHPSLSDLVMHGGVLALDRVQQVIWTLIALGMFMRIVVTTFGTAQGLPPIPQELLVLMGLSSAGYLGGKLVRGAGPVINEVVAREGSVTLTIRGKHFSKDCFVWVDGVKQDSTGLKFTDDPDDAKYAKEIELTLANLTLDAWNGAEHAITIVNDDAQRADWRSVGSAASSDPTAPNVGGTTAADTASAEAKAKAAADAQAAADAKAAADAQATENGGEPEGGEGQQGENTSG